MMAEDYDLASLQVAEPVFGAQDGYGVLRVHPHSKCEGRDIPCCIHAPSDHHMRSWPLNWRGDTQVMERLCPHGIGHPDPDHMAYVRSLTPEHECVNDEIFEIRKTSPDFWVAEDEWCPYPHLNWQGIHGCDGCC